MSIIGFIIVLIFSNIGIWIRLSRHYSKKSLFTILVLINIFLTIAYVKSNLYGP